jgi:hypothetical protein
MTPNSHGGPAKIYEFPRRGRFAERGQLDEPASAGRLPSAAKAVFGGSWYHEEAIQEERARKD